MESFYILSHLFLLVLLSQFVTRVNTLDGQSSTIVIVVVVILIIFVGVLGVFIGIVLLKITNIFGIFKKQQESRFSRIVAPPTLRPSSYMLPNNPDEAPPNYDEVRDGETTSDRQSDHLPPPE